EESFYGLAGDIVRTVERHTEADRVAILAHVLAFFGNAAGPTPHIRVGADVHRANLFIVIVGRTSRGRKGTSEGQARRIFTEADEEWTKNRVVHGLSSGEGLIDAVRDPDPNDDAPPPDRRLMVVESEFAATLRVMRRDGNTLSAILRQAWDSGDLRVITRKD